MNNVREGTGEGDSRTEIVLSSSMFSWFFVFIKNVGESGGEEEEEIDGEIGEDDDVVNGEEFDEEAEGVWKKKKSPENVMMTTVENATKILETISDFFLTTTSLTF